LAAGDFLFGLGLAFLFELAAGDGPRLDGAALSGLESELSDGEEMYLAEVGAAFLAPRLAGSFLRVGTAVKLGTIFLDCKEENKKQVS